jgi:hypothetical protein
MQLLEEFLVSCGEAVDRLGEEGPEDRPAQITEKYMLLVDHGNLCEDCNEAEGPQSEGADERPKEDKLAPVEETFANYRAGFQAGQNLKL